MMKEGLNQVKKDWRKTYSHPTNEKARKARTARNLSVIRKAKSNPCTDCGQSYPFYVMDFDHVRGIKRFSLSKVHGRSLAVIETEMAKCEIVCANCHRERTYSRNVFLNEDKVNDD